MRELVLWGHHWQEYQEMFDLSPEDLQGNLLEFGSGPSAVNAELHEGTAHIVSADALFNLDKATLFSKTALIFEDRLSLLRKEQAQFNFSRYGGIDKFIASRRRGLKEFFDDYEKGRTEKRYIPVKGYELPFADHAFDLALCSHYLFTDLDAQDTKFHLRIIRELARVAKEVRIFPLIDCQGETSPLMGPVLLGLQQSNYGVEMRNVDYSLQAKGNALLKVWALQCEVK